MRDVDVRYLLGRRGSRPLFVLQDAAWRSPPSSAQSGGGRERVCE